MIAPFFVPSFGDICTSATMGIFPHIKGPAKPRNPYRNLTPSPSTKTPPLVALVAFKACIDWEPPLGPEP